MYSDKIRHYPKMCLSQFCGDTVCDSCKLKPELDEFKQWVEDNNAVVRDRIWSPNTYLARRV